MRIKMHRVDRAITRGFSLVEMLLVIAVVTILIALSAKGLRSTWRSQQNYASASALLQAFSLAKSTAVRYSKPVQVRIYRFEDGDLTSKEAQFRAYQVVGVHASVSGDAFSQVSELQKFEGTTVMSKFAKYSSIVSGNTRLPSDDTYSYVAVEFRPDGSTNLETNPAQPWTITLLSDFGSEDEGKLPKDARTLVISPDTGAVSLY